MSFIQNLGYILMGFIALVSVFLIILALLEKKLHIKFLRGRYSKNEFYIGKISKLDVNKPKESLKIFDKIAKSFFIEAFHIKGSPEYSWLENFFKKKNNKKATGFCNEMTQFLYSKKDISKTEFQTLIKLLAEIISSNKIISKEEKKELDEKSLEKKTLLAKTGLGKILKRTGIKNKN